MEVRAAKSAAWRGAFDVLSPEVRATVLPYSTMRQALAMPDAAPSWWLVVRRPLLLLVVLGAFVSLTAAYRLTVGHVGWAMLGWAFLPGLQVAGLAGTLAIFRRRRLRELPRLIDVSFYGRAPWHGFLVGLVLLHVLLLDPRTSFFALFLGGPVPIAIVVCAIWARVIDHAFWRALGLSRLGAVAAVLVGDVLVLGPGVGWYLLTEQLQPLLSGGP